MTYWTTGGMFRWENLRRGFIALDIGIAPVMRTAQSHLRASSIWLLSRTGFVALVVSLLFAGALSDSITQGEGVAAPGAHSASVVQSTGAEQMAAARESLNTSDLHPTGTQALTGTSPSPRAWAAMTWDAAAGVVLLFGGSSSWGEASNAGYPDLNDTWSFSGGIWTQLFPATSPPATSMAAMAYDPNLDAVLMYGGEVPLTGSTALTVNSTWQFKDGNWDNISGTTSPSPRVSASMSTDTAFGGVVLFGGLQEVRSDGPNGSELSETAESDTWAYGSAGWVNVSGSVGTQPSARFNAGMTFDPTLSAVVLFGGWVSLADNTPTLNDTWLLNASGWTESFPAHSPPGLGGVSMAYVSESGSLALFGGLNPSDDLPSNETWSFSDGNWTHLAPGTIPLATYQGSFADDPVDGYGVLLLGATAVAYSASEATWTFSQGGWAALGENDSQPPAGPATMVYDAETQSVVLVSPTESGSSIGLESTWVFQNGNWSAVNTSTAPDSRADPALVYDQADGYVLFFGGSYHTDTWAFQDGNWTELFPSSRPAASYSAGIAYDARDGYVVYYDGTATWKWSEGNWTNLNLTYEPPLGGRDLDPNSMTYDAHDGYVLMVQSSNASCESSAPACLLVWAFFNGAWADLTGVSSQTPSALLGASIEFDSASQQVILFGGYCPWAACPAYASNATWSYIGGQWSVLDVANSPAPRAFAALTYDGPAGALLLFGGVGFAATAGMQSASSVFADTWTYSGTAWTQILPSLTVSNASVDVGVRTTLTASNPSILGRAQYAYLGLPGGCHSADSPSINCTPTDSGTFDVVMSVQYSGSAPSNASVTISVASLPRISEFVASPEYVRPEGTSYLTVKFTGGTSPFDIQYFGLPPGCLSSDQAFLACTPAVAGNFTVTVFVTDQFGRSANLSLNLTVTSAVPMTTPGPAAWFDKPTVFVLVGLAAGAVVAASALVKRNRRRRESEKLIEDIRAAITEGPRFWKRPPR